MAGIVARSFPRRVWHTEWPRALRTTSLASCPYRRDQFARKSPPRAFHASSRAFLRRENETNARSVPDGDKSPPQPSEKLDELHSLLQSSSAESHPSLNVYHIAAPHTGSIKVISLNRPKARNAISRQLLQDLSQQIESIHGESHAGQTRALILASEIDGAFCAGADLAERKGMTQDETRNFLSELRFTFKRIDSLPIPSISCVAGYALGGGLELALCTNLRVFSWNATVGLPETSLAIIPGGGGTYRLPRIVGLAKARELILTARRLTGEEALEIGLCNRYVKATGTGFDSDKEVARKLSLLESIHLAHDISRNGPVALKAAIQAMKDGGSEEAENSAYETILHTADRIEALKAFSEKRRPTFTGE